MIGRRPGSEWDNGGSSGGGVTGRLMVAILVIFGAPALTVTGAIIWTITQR